MFILYIHHSIWSTTEEPPKKRQKYQNTCYRFAFRRMLMFVHTNDISVWFTTKARISLSSDC